MKWIVCLSVCYRSFSSTMRIGYSSVRTSWPASSTEKMVQGFGTSKNRGSLQDPKCATLALIYWANPERLLNSFNRCRFNTMTLLRRIESLVVLVAWLPATTHCLLGAVLEESESSGCCSESRDQQNEHRDLGGCGICDTCESGDYLLSTQSIFIQGFHATLSCALLFPDRVVDFP